MCDHDIEVARRARDLERYHRRTAERRTQGLCLKCGKRPPAPHRSQCEPCIEKRGCASYYTSTISVEGGLGYRLSPRKPSPRLFCRRRVGDFEQTVARVAENVSAQEPGLAPLVDGSGRDRKTLGGLVDRQQPTVAQPLIA